MFLTALLMTLLFLTALILIGIILVQRGKGGGLAGAFGGLGGQSAFGAKAGDTFTRITIGVAAVWIVLCMVSIKTLGHQQSRLKLTPARATQNSTTLPNDRGAAGLTQSPPAEKPSEGATGTSTATPPSSGAPAGTTGGAAGANSGSNAPSSTPAPAQGKTGS